MKGIDVDPEHRTARAQGGVTWREFNRATQLHGLATTGGVMATENAGRCWTATRGQVHSLVSRVHRHQCTVATWSHVKCQLFLTINIKNNTHPIARGGRDTLMFSGGVSESVTRPQRPWVDLDPLLVDS
jgi:hypothetical protein